jgi:hypothetical protein
MDICGDVCMQEMAPRGRRTCGGMAIGCTDGEMGVAGACPRFTFAPAKLLAT